MNHNRKVIHVMLFGLVLFFLLGPAIAGAETDPLTICINDYLQKGKTVDEAKKLCSANVNPTAVQTAQPSTQQLPDMYVKGINCATPGNKLEFTAVNSLAPIPSGWMAVADVYFDGEKKGSIDLGRPTTGDLTVGGATYLTAFEIAGSVEVKIVLDPTNSIKETNEANNAMVAKITCQAAGDTTTTTTAADPVAECIAKQQQLRGMSYDEAKKLCAAVQTPEYVKTVINRCGELETKLNILMEKLRVAQGQDTESIMKDILALKTELRSCQVQTPQATKVITPGIKNPCDELAMIKDSIAQIERKIIVIKEAILKGEMTETDLASYTKEYNYLRERLEKMSFACQQGKPLEESPCVRLSRLELIYRQINDGIAGANDDKMVAALKDKLARLANEIEAEKQRCRGEKLDSEKVDTLYDLEKAYRAKQKAIVEGTSDVNMQGDLAKVEDEKKKLLDEFALRTSDLDARKSTIIRKLQIKDGNIILDDLKTKARKVKLDLKDKEIEIESQDGGSAITDGSTTAQGDVPLEFSDGALISTKSGKEIKMMPGALMRAIEGKDYVKIDDEVTWLPITIVFSATQLSPQPDPPGITLPAGTKGEKIGEGHYKFLLPDGQTIELKDYDGKTKTGDVSILGKDGAATASGMKGILTGAPKPKKSAAAISPSDLKELLLKDDGKKPEYLAKEDKKGKLLWLIPTTISTEYRISAEDGTVIETKAPWWRAIASVDVPPIEEVS